MLNNRFYTPVITFKDRVSNVGVGVVAGIGWF